MRAPTLLVAISLLVLSVLWVSPFDLATGPWRGIETGGVRAGESRGESAALLAAKARIRRLYGVRVEFEKIDFPSYWRKEYAPLYKTAPPERRLAAIEKLEQDFSVYAKGVVRENLRTIFIVESLSFKGAPYGGTIYPPERALYLHEGWLGDFRALNTAGGFHHELSSILLARHPFPKREWGALNPPGFAYSMVGESWRKITEGDTDLFGSPELHQRGFICGYGTLDIEEDINTFAQLYFGNPSRLAQLAKRYPAIDAKMRLMDGAFGRFRAAARVATR